MFTLSHLQITEIQFCMRTPITSYTKNLHLYHHLPACCQSNLWFPAWSVYLMNCTLHTVSKGHWMGNLSLKWLVLVNKDYSQALLLYPEAVKKWHLRWGDSNLLISEMRRDRITSDLTKHISGAGQMASKPQQHVKKLQID